MIVYVGEARGEKTGIKTYILTVEGRLDHLLLSCAISLIFALVCVIKGVFKSGGQVISTLERIVIRASTGSFLLGLLLLLLVLPATLEDGLEYHRVRCEHVRGEEWELVGLIVVVRILGVLDGVRYELLECRALAHEFDKLGNAASAAEHDELFFLKEQLFDSAALLLVQDLVDLYVSSAAKDKHIFSLQSTPTDFIKILQGLTSG